MPETDLSRYSVKYRGYDSDYDELMKVPIRRFFHLEDAVFDPKTAARYIITDPRHELPLDVLFIPRKSSDRLLVGFHGAEHLATADFPKFQFVNSFKSRKESLFFVFDSTLLQGKKANIGWLAGNAKTPLASLVSLLVCRAGDAMKVRQTVLVGHSAGGFKAILVGSKVPNSRAISVNGQGVVSRHRPWSIKNLQESAFPECLTSEVMTSRYPERFDLRAVMETRISSSSFTYFGNRPDSLTFSEYPHFPLLANHFGLDEKGGITSHGDAFVPCEWESKNPNPHALPGTVIPFLQAVLGEKTDLAIKYSVNPIWHPEDFHSPKTCTHAVSTTRPFAHTSDDGYASSMTSLPLESLDLFGTNAPVREVENIFDFQPEDSLGAMRYRGVLEPGVYLDAIIANKKSDVLVVGFHGAIDRLKTNLPRFERLRTVLDHNVSSIFFGDPALWKADNLQLAWYTGWKDMDVHQIIADWSVSAARAIGAKKIIFTGSSGGGFAALQVGSLVPKSMSLAFNAQTSISEYRVGGTGFGPQRHYVKTLWPEIHNTFKTLKDIEDPSWSDKIDDRTSAVERYGSSTENYVFLVQNTEEFHYEDHYLPFLAAAERGGNMDRIRTKTFLDGPIHAQPKAPMFIETLKEAVDWSSSLPQTLM